MTDEERQPFLSLGSCLLVASLLYGRAVKLRERLYQIGILRSERLPCKVISVGNLTLGGTGKTPLTIYLADMLTRLGCKTAVISRGYKGTLEKTGGIVSDGQTIFMGPELAGDEPFMMAEQLRDVPVLVGQDRLKSGMRAIQEYHPDVILLDDAFQHLRLARDLDLVLLDSRIPFGNSHLMPRGTLRESISALSRAHGIILTRCDPAESDACFRLTPHAPSCIPVFRSFHEPYIYKVVPCGSDDLRRQGHPTTEGQASLNADQPDISEFLSGRRVFAFSGIAKNDDFRNTLHSLGAEVAGFEAFSDHHSYSDHDLEAISYAATSATADLLVTTEKDHVRIAGRRRWPLDVAVIGINISFGDGPDAFSRFIEISCVEDKKGD